MKTNNVIRNKSAIFLNLAAGLLLIITGITVSIACAATGNSLIGRGLGAYTLNKHRIIACFLIFVIFLSPLLIISGIYTCRAKQKKYAMSSTLLSVATTTITLSIILFLIHFSKAANVIRPVIYVPTLLAFIVSIACSITNIANTVKIWRQSSTNESGEITDDKNGIFSRINKVWVIITISIVSLLFLSFVIFTIYSIIDTFTISYAHKEENGYLFFIFSQLNYFFIASTFFAIRAFVSKIQSTVLSKIQKN